MTTSPDPNARSLRRRIARRLPERRDDSGLTTLEWLLIVAAVAGLAALAVVLVTNVVGSTSEQISGSSARLTAAKVAASAVVTEANTVDGDATQYDSWVSWDSYYTSRCERIEITYSDAVDDVVATFTAPVPAVGFPAAAATVVIVVPNAATTGLATCVVTP